MIDLETKIKIYHLLSSEDTSNHKLAFSMLAGTDVHILFDPEEDGFHYWFDGVEQSIFSSENGFSSITFLLPPSNGDALTFNTLPVNILRDTKRSECLNIANACGSFPCLPIVKFNYIQAFQPDTQVWFVHMKLKFEDQIAEV